MENSYLKIYHGIVKNTLAPLPANKSPFLEIGKRIGLIVVSPLAYIALTFLAMANSLRVSLKGRFTKNKPEQKLPLENRNHRTDIINDIDKYKNSTLLGMQDYIKQADGKVFAIDENFSDFHKMPFVDPLTGKCIASAEHMLQAYRFPSADLKHSQILNADTTEEAIKLGLELTASIQSSRWEDCVENLRVFIQMTKALNTEFGRHLENSKNEFIINENSEGTNIVGWAQMQARAYMREIKDNKGNFSHEDLIDYYHNYVEASLNSYYNSISQYHILLELT